MEILELQSGRYKSPELVNGLQDTITHLMGAANYGYLLPHGWRTIIEIDSPEDPDDHFLLDAQADEGGGSFAKVKMDTLKQYHETIATGLLKYKDLEDLVLTAIHCDRIAREDMIIATDLIRRTDGIALSRMQHEWLRDKLNVTNFMGGIRLGIYGQESVLDSDDESFRKKGEIRVAVSGAAEWQDAYLALVIASFVIQTFNYEITPESREKLLSIPNLRFFYRFLNAPPLHPVSLIVP